MLVEPSAVSSLPNIVSRDSNWTFNFYVGVVN